MSETDIESIDEFFEQMKVSVRSSFVRLYAALKARELQTLRQLHAVRKQCETSHAHSTHCACLRSLRLSFDSESSLLEQIARHGSLHLDSLNLEGDIFLVEDYICPEEDHMYSYKCIDELTNVKASDFDLGIEEEALKQITSMEDCVCSVSLTPEEISKQFREEPEVETTLKSCENVEDSSSESQSMKIESPNQSLNTNVDEINSENTASTEQKTEDESPSVDEATKINPTEEWLNCIKGQIETEPTQATDVMEHSTIVC